MRISFFGADQTVTGSKHMIQTGNFSLLLDCGMFQGKRSLANQLNSGFSFDASKVDAMILSHAHLDHCGMIPILVRQGFRGKIYATPATIDIAKYIMQDSAAIQENDAEYYNRHNKDKPISPIYTAEDVLKTFNYFEPVQYFRNSGKWTQINKDVRFKFNDAGHILGSAVTVLEINEVGTVKTIAYTGDLGREYMPILKDPEFVEEAQALLMECTYGGRLHRSVDTVTEELKSAIELAIINKGKVIVPAFALGRTQELIYIIHKLIDGGNLPSIPIYIDSPLGENITEVYARYTGDFNDAFWNDFGNKKESPFDFKNLVNIQSVGESKALNNTSGPLMIISASGMAEGGRILHHLKNSISDPKNIILLAGYQAENTLGRRLEEGATSVKIYDKEYEVHAKILKSDELSAHADQNDLFIYMSHIKGLKNLFLIHGELPEASAFEKIAKEYSPNLSVDIPLSGQSFDI